jgi:hypothetical protein
MGSNTSTLAQKNKDQHFCFKELADIKQEMGQIHMRLHNVINSINNLELVLTNGNPYYQSDSDTDTDSDSSADSSCNDCNSDICPGDDNVDAEVNAAIDDNVDENVTAAVNNNVDENVTAAVNDNVTAAVNDNVTAAVDDADTNSD